MRLPVYQTRPSSSNSSEGSMPGASSSQKGSDQGPAGSEAVTMKFPRSFRKQAYCNLGPYRQLLYCGAKQEHRQGALAQKPQRRDIMDHPTRCRAPWEKTDRRTFDRPHPLLRSGDGKRALDYARHDRQSHSVAHLGKRHCLSHGWFPGKCPAGDFPGQG